MGRRGQAAHEFVTTYGWVALLSLAAIGVMLLLSGQRVVVEECAFPAPIECVRVDAHPDGKLTMLLLNRGPAVALREISCMRGGEPSVTTRTGLVGGERLAGYAWGAQEFVEASCQFDGDNPFAGRQGSMQELVSTLEISDVDGKGATKTGAVRAFVEAQ